MYSLVTLQKQLKNAKANTRNSNNKNKKNKNKLNFMEGIIWRRNFLNSYETNQGLSTPW